MVVTRKKPAVPAPASSRTNSSQPIPRAAKVKTPEPHALSAGENGFSSTGRNSSPSSSSSKLKDKSKSGKKPSSPPLKRSLIDVVFLPFLAAIFCYALAVCPTDHSQSHTICRSLATYRHVILEPYVLPPIRAAVTHPVVIDTYKSHVEPYVHQIQVTSAPYVAKASIVEKQLRPHVTRVARAVSNTVSRAWYDVLEPYWRYSVLPRYKLFVAPYVQRYLAPIYASTDIYRHKFQTYIRPFAYNISTKYHAVKPYFVRAYVSIKPYIERAYVTIKPHAVALWERALPVLCSMWKYANVQIRVAIRLLGLQLRRGTREVGNARRQYVDPHVRRIWEKVAETSAAPLSQSTVNLDDIQEGDTTAESIQEPTSASTYFTTSPIPSESVVSHKEIPVSDVPVVAETADDEYVNITPTSTPAEPIESAVRVAEASAGHASSIVGELEREIHSVLVNQVAESPTPAPDAVVEATEEATPTLAAPMESASSIEFKSLHPGPIPTIVDEDEFDDFLRDIGLDDEESSQEIIQPDAPVAGEAPSAISAEEKAAEIAAKRTNIVGRHVRWQAELAALVREKEARVKQDVKALRSAAVQELREIEQGLRSTSGEPADNRGKGVVDALQGEGEKLLRGLEGYLKKAEGRSVGWKREPGHKDAAKEELRKEEEAKWSKVLEKVASKFEETVTSVQAEVHTWFVATREKEVQVVLQASHDVKTLAEKAQADIGLDYAWLEDVTYQDWQKYHDLMGTSESFAQTARSLQNGTHPAAPSDPLIPALNNLDREVDDVISGFEVRLHEISSISREIFSPFNGEAEEDVTLNSVEGLQNNPISTATAAEEPTYSILPISPPVEESNNEQVLDASRVVIGKSKEQIEQALSGTSPEPSADGESENENVVDAAKVIIGKTADDIEHAVRAEAGISHEEL